MVKTVEKLHKTISDEHFIPKDVTDTLIELDTLPSTTTQAYLNDILDELYHRVLDKSDDIVVEVFGENVITSEEFLNWVHDNFTDYSYNLLKRTIGIK